jgi:hypothetical protein
MLLVATGFVLGGCGRVGYDLITERRSSGGKVAGDAGQGAASAADSSVGAGAPSGDAGKGATGSGGATGTDAGGTRSAGGTVTGTGGVVSGTGGGSALDAAVADAARGGACGDGFVQAGEACDDRGASATCNANCTFSSCGDGQLDPVSGEICDDGDRLASCSTTCSAVTCRAGCTCEWYFGHRYMLCPDKLSYTAARGACTSSGMRLVRLTSGEEHSFLRLRSQKDSYSKYHIGASDAAMEGKWLWDDGTQFWNGNQSGTAVGGKFAFWASGEPNDQNGDENCAEVQSIQGFNDSVCDAETKPFICKQYRDPRPKCGDGSVESGEACDDGKATAACDADCSPVVCGDGVANAAAGEECDDGGTGQYCSSNCKQFVCPASCSCFNAASHDYALCKTAAAFRDAELFCGAHGMALASVGSSTEDQALRTEATDAGVSDYWMGGTDLDGEGQWMWLDTTRFWSGTAAGKALAYAHFAPTAPAGGTATNCLRVTSNGQWTDAECTTTFAYVCERLLP